MDDLTPWSDVQHALEVTAFEAVRKVIRTFPGGAERNAVVWRGVRAYGAVVGRELERLRKERDDARALVETALDLRMHAKRWDRGWNRWDTEAERFLRAPETPHPPDTTGETGTP